MLKEDFLNDYRTKLQFQLEKFQSDLEYITNSFLSGRIKRKIPNLVANFEKLVEDCLFAIGVNGRNDKERVHVAIRFLKIYDPRRVDLILKILKNPEMEKQAEINRLVEELKELMEKALKRCEELLNHV